MCQVLRHSSEFAIKAERAQSAVKQTLLTTYNLLKD